jgi:hypothetical protein
LASVTLTPFSVALLLVVIALVVPLRSALTDTGARPVFRCVRRRVLQLKNRARRALRRAVRLNYRRADHAERAYAEAFPVCGAGLD